MNEYPRSIELSKNGHIARVAANTDGRDFVVGDIHGYFNALSDLLHQAGFDEGRDRLFSVGDLIDRGPESAHAIDWLESGRITLASMGNHEEMMLRALGSPVEDDADVYAALSVDEAFGLWYMNGGKWWEDEGREPGSARRWTDALSALPYAYTIATPHGGVGVVHSCPMWSDWDRFLFAMERGPQGARTRAVWTRERSRGIFQREIDREPGSSEGEVPMGRYTGVRAVMAGHSPVKEVRWDANLLNLDSGVRSYGRLSMAEINRDPIMVHAVGVDSSRNLRRRRGARP